MFINGEVKEPPNSVLVCGWVFDVIVPNQSGGELNVATGSFRW